VTDSLLGEEETSSGPASTGIREIKIYILHHK